MTTQSIRGSTSKIIGNSVPGANVNGKQQVSNFEQIMTSSMNQKWDMSKAVSFNQEAANDARSDANKADKYSKTAMNKASETAIRGKSSASISERETMKDIAEETMDDIANDKEAIKDKKNAELLNQIMELLNSIQQAALQILNRTPEELQQLMESQGMTITDLQNPDMLRQLVLADRGQTDISAILMDENLADTMRKLLLEADELTANSGLDFTDEQVKNILAQLDNALVNDTDSLNSNVVQGNIVQEQNNTPELYITQDANVHATDEEAKSKAAMDEMNPYGYGNYQEISMDNQAVRLDTEDAMHSLSDGENSEVQNQSNEQYETKTVDDVSGFVNQMIEVTQRTQMDNQGNTVQITELREIANQIIDQIKVVVHQDHTSMELQLNPNSLGKVNLSVQSKDGVITAHFVVENELTKETIESQLVTLKNTLEQQGIKVETIEVTIANYSFEQSGHADTQKEHGQQENTARRKLTLDEAIQMSETQEEMKTVDITGMRGTQIDYTA